MARDARADLRFEIDHLVLRNSRVFGWGWVAHRERVVRQAHFVFEGGGEARRVAASLGLARKDVQDAFPDFAASGASGFILTGYVPGAGAKRVTLEIAFDDGSSTEIPVDRFAERAQPAKVAQRTLGRMARAAWRRVRVLDFSGLLRGRGGRRFGIGTLDDARERERLTRILAGAASVRVIFDHSMGGGANEYRRGLIEKWLAQGETVLFVTFNLPTLDYRMHLAEPAGREHEWRSSSFLNLSPALPRDGVAEFVVNSPVSFDEPAGFARWVAHLRREHADSRLTVTLHDYFPVCPSFVLLNHAGVFCGIPDVSECDACLAKHEGAPVALSPPSAMREWRAAWSTCLEAADEVRCFSEASRKLLLRAFPATAAKATVVPHAVEFTPGRLPRVRHGAPLVIGVVGQIRLEKGSGIVARLVRELERGDADVRVVVVGTLDVPIESPRLAVTGAYRREDLVDLIERHGINVFLFPSIWPETFSFVVSEMMALGLPIVAFDLGAPAERLREYRWARLCREVSAKAALDAAISLHREAGSAKAQAV